MGGHWYSTFLYMLLVTVGSAQQLPQPDAIGVYASGKGVEPAKLIHAVPATYPVDKSVQGQKHVTSMRIVIGTDGKPGAIEIQNSQIPAFDRAAIEAAEKSEFEPGKRGDTPVPVYIVLMFPFSEINQPVLPIVSRIPQPEISAPMPLNNVVAEYSAEARKQKIEGQVEVFVYVTEEGQPSQIRVLKPLGYGLDEKAIEAVRKWRFRPAMLAGVPIRTDITVEVNFRLN